MPDAFDLAVLIGRFQPFHAGHAGLLAHALTLAKRVVAVLGSANSARSVKNPWTWQERAAMIAASLSPADAQRITFVPIRDFYDEPRWAEAVVAAVHAGYDGPALPRVALVGFVKDASSGYLGGFPQWTFVALERQGDIDATTVRRAYFSAASDADAGSWRRHLPVAVARFLADWRATPAYARLREEQQTLAQLAPLPDAATARIEVAALVTTGERVALIRRLEPPGRDLWSLPTALPQARERLATCAARLWRDLCGVASPPTCAAGEVRIFDHPERSPLGRRVLCVYPLSVSAPAPQPAFSAWIAHADLPSLEAELFEDHFHVLNRLLTER